MTFEYSMHLAADVGLVLSMKTSVQLLHGLRSVEDRCILNADFRHFGRCGTQNGRACGGLLVLVLSGKRGD